MSKKKYKILKGYADAATKKAVKEHCKNAGKTESTFVNEAVKQKLYRDEGKKLL